MIHYKKVLVKRFRASKTDFEQDLSSFPPGRSKAVHLLQFFFVCASVVTYVGMFLTNLSYFGASGRLCLVTVTSPGSLCAYFKYIQTQLTKNKHS